MYLHTFVEIFKSWRTSKNLFARFSPVCDPESKQKSKIEDFNNHSLLIQWTEIPRNGIWFLLVHASTVKDSKPGSSYLFTIKIYLNFKCNYLIIIYIINYSLAMFHELVF